MGADRPLGWGTPGDQPGHGGGEPRGDRAELANRSSQAGSSIIKSCVPKFPCICPLGAQASRLHFSEMRPDGCVPGDASHPSTRERTLVLVVDMAESVSEVVNVAVTVAGVEIGLGPLQQRASSERRRSRPPLRVMQAGRLRSQE